MTPTQPVPTGVGDVFQLFRDGRPRTKAELTRITGLARSTVSSRVDALLATGLLVPAGEAASSGGRPPATLVFNPHARVVIAADLGASHGFVAVCTLTGEVLSSVRSDIAISEGPDAVLSWVADAARACLAEIGKSLDDVVGVGVGVPGPVEHSTGRPAKPPIMPGWDGFDVPAFVAERLRGPVFVDNDVNILALGERATVWPDIDDLVYVKVATGIGSGIISGGRLQRGALGTAGDIGHVQVPFSRDSPREPGDERDLEAVAGGMALAAQLHTDEHPVRTSADVVARLNAGDPHAVELVRQAGREVGEVLAMTVNLLNPSVIVIGGSIGIAGEHLLAGVREVVYRRSIPLATQHLSIVQSRSGGLGGAIGAAHLVIEHALEPHAVDALVAAG
ncbi:MULTISPECIES: ROK family protein [unclassified Plantibacter]|jgi:predicted NBD/HSP70 family sugar kinase|uniref:ROK family transcriptional regulator n=1 Tax=unclassified Plantibacter TaxID=2624265 RepID=UPI003D33CCDB